MSTNNKTRSKEWMELEWKEIQVAKSNPASFKLLYDRYYESIFRFVYNRCDNEYTTQDICSDVFLIAMQNLRTYKFKGVPFSAWLFRIAHNELRHYYRTSKKKRIVKIRTINFLDIYEDEDEELNYIIENRDRILHILEELKPVEIQLIELRFFEKRKFKEIANILELKEGTAKMKTYRTLKKIKSKLMN